MYSYYSKNKGDKSLLLDLQEIFLDRKPVVYINYSP